MKTLVLPLALAALASPAFADQARCSWNDAPATPCTFSDTVGPDGLHHMRFDGAGQPIAFVGKSQTGWWAGKLNGEPAMGYERNRGNTVFATSDLTKRFAWWYPAEEHGSY